MYEQSIGSPLLWLGFTIFVALMLALDLGVVHRKAHVVRNREALVWSIVWISLALLFNLGIWRWFGRDRALEFLTGYLVEKALSVDNLFVFLILFHYFHVPPQHQHRVLFWGILGAVVLRALFVFAGAALLTRFAWLSYLLGAFLVVTGIRLLSGRGTQVHPEKNPLLRLFRRLVPAVGDYREGRFFVREHGRRFATPLLFVLVTVEATDVVFAVDSIPAIFAITRDPFLVYTSNIFAILGLRALFFLLAGTLERFHHMKVALGMVLAFVGIKMLIAEQIEVPIVASLAVIASLLALGILASLIWPRPPAHLPPGGAEAGAVH